jgi:hypothetical protein
MLMTETKSSKETDGPFEEALRRAHSKDLEEKYFKIWTAEIEHTKTRWTVSTFFFSVSFAIFGFSFQAQLARPLPNIARISGLIIYWFAYLIFSRFNQYTIFLREYLKEMEEQEQVSVKLQTRLLNSAKYKNKQRMSATNLLIYFGILYTLGVVALWVLRF